MLVISTCVWICSRLFYVCSIYDHCMYVFVCKHYVLGEEFYGFMRPMLYLVTLTSFYSILKTICSFKYFYLLYFGHRNSKKSLTYTNHILFYTVVLYGCILIGILPAKITDVVNAFIYGKSLYIKALTFM